MRGIDKDIPSFVREEIAKIYLEYRDNIFKIVHVRIMDEDVAGDITQEVFLEAMYHYEDFSQHPNQIGWLYKVMHYKMMEYFRRLRNCEILNDEESMPEISSEDEGFAQMEFKIVLKDILTPEEELRFKRYFVWGEEVEKIAEKEQISKENMHVRLTRLKQKIYEAFTGISK